VWINPPVEKAVRQDAPGPTISAADDPEYPLNMSLTALMRGGFSEKVVQ
jgi:hypothetical protein